MSKTRQNDDYWTLSFQDKTSFYLPRHFGHEIFDMIQEFMGNRPIFKPPHDQDLMDIGDNIY